MDPLVITFAAGLLGAVVAIAALLVSQRRTRRQVNLLMRRIDELQQRVSDGGQVPSPPAFGVASDSEGARRDGDRLTLDVLGGRTSFVRRAVDGGLSQPASLAGQAITLIHEHIRDRLTAAELADELAISLRSLERGLAAELGCSPRQLILAMKMREARRLLSTGRLRVNEVSNQLGFANPSHFSRSFRTFYRMPPSQSARASSSQSGGVNR